MTEEQIDRDGEIEEIRLEVGAIMEEQNARQTKVNRRQESTIAGLVEKRITDLARALERFTASPGAPQMGEFHGRSSRLVRVDFPRFDGSDPQGWLYLVEEYFGFHGISEKGKV